MTKLATMDRDARLGLALAHLAGRDIGSVTADEWGDVASQLDRLTSSNSYDEMRSILARQAVVLQAVSLEFWTRAGSASGRATTERAAVAASADRLLLRCLGALHQLNKDQITLPGALAVGVGELDDSDLHPR